MNDYGWSHLTRRDKEAILKGLGTGDCFGGPYHVEIHPSSRCGLRCFFCSTHSWRTRQDLPLATIERLAVEMESMGTRAVCLSGGGEPLCHPHALEMIHCLASHKVPVGHLTTNGQHLAPEIADALIDTGCRQVIVSMNCGTASTYAKMMNTSPDVFHRVSRNIASLVSRRQRNRSGNPSVLLQFLVYKHNVDTIPEMYEHACSLGVDSIVFNGLSFLAPADRMNEAETRTMFKHLRAVMLRDEYRRVLGVNSFEHDMRTFVHQIEAEIGERRKHLSAVRRLHSTLTRRDYSWRQKWNHHWRMRRRTEQKRLISDNIDPCIRPWYSLTVRTDGSVPVCCARQEQILANLDAGSLSDIWFGSRFQRLRTSMQAAITQGSSWRADEDPDSGVASRCSAASSGIERCPFRSFYFSGDQRFMHGITTLIS